MAKFGQNGETFLLNLSSLWRTLFKDVSTLETLYQGAEALLGESYRDTLGEVLGLSLSTTPIYETDYWRTFYFNAGSLDIRDLGGGDKEYAFPLDDEIIDIPLLQNRLSGATLMWEKDRAYRLEFDTLGKRIVFDANPLESADIINNFVRSAQETVFTSKDGVVSSGTPNEHLPTEATARLAALNARYETRRTFTTRGVLHVIRAAQFYNSKPSWVEVSQNLFTQAYIGYKVYVPSVGQTRTITTLVSPKVVIVDSAFTGVTEPFDLEILNDDLFQEEHLGFELVIDDVGNNDNDGVYVIKEILSGTSVKLDRALSFADAQAPKYTSVTRAALVFTIPTAATRFLLSDVGSYLYISDGSSNAGWFKITAVGSFNPGGFGEEVTVSDPGSVLSGFDTTGITASLHQTVPKAQGLVWILQSPALVARAKLYAPGVSIETHMLRDRYGVLVDRKADSSEQYKNLLQGIYQYYWGGPTIFNLESALNTMVGFPVAELEGELLIRVDETATADTVVTDNKEYVFNAGYVKDELKDPSVWSSKTFKRLESMTNVFIIEDHVSDPTWAYNLLLPENVLPEETTARRLISPRLQPTNFDGTWNYGDPGVFYGAQLNGEPLEDNVIEFTDGFVSGTTLTTLTTRLFAEYVGKTIYIGNRRHTIVAVTSENSAEIDSELDPLVVAEEPTEYAGTYLAGAFTAATHVFQPSDLGRTIEMDFFGWNSYTILDVAGSAILLVEGGGGGLGKSVPATVRFPDEGGIDSCIIINRQPLHPTLGFAVAEGFAKANMFGVRYAFDDTATNFASLQSDIEDIIVAGKPSHVLLLNQPWQTLSDLWEVYDAITNMAFNFSASGESMPMLSRELLFDGSWNYGDFFFHANGYVTWDKRLSIGDITTLPTAVVDGSGNQLYAVFDARNASEVWMTPSINIGGEGQQFRVDVYGWEDITGSFVHTGHFFEFDTDNLLAKKVDVGGLFLAFLLTYNTGSDACFTVGARRSSVVERRGTSYFPAGTGTITTGRETLVDASFAFYPTDIGREVFLEYLVGVSMTYTRARIVKVDASDTVSLVDAATGEPFLSPVTTAAATWHFGAQLRWGQTGIIYGGLMPGMDAPIGVSTNDVYAVEQPVQVTVRDTILPLPMYLLRSFLFRRNQTLYLTT